MNELELRFREATLEMRMSAAEFNAPSSSAYSSSIDRELAQSIAIRIVQAAMQELNIPFVELTPRAHFDARVKKLTFTGWPDGLIETIDSQFAARRIRSA